MSRPKGSRNKYVRVNEYELSPDSGGLIIVLKDRNGVPKAKTKIDYSFAEESRKFHWGLSGNGYAVTTIRGKNKYLHHFILPRKKGFDVDHINRNPLDNRLSNLRYLTHAGNLRNNDAKGVCFTKRNGTWFAYVNSGKERKTLGFGYKTFAEAKEVRDNYIKTLIK